MWHYAVDDGFVLNMRMAYDRVDIRKQYRVLNGIQLRSVLFSTNSHCVQFCIVSVGFNPDIELRRRSDYLVWLPLQCSDCILAIVNTMVIFCLKKEKIMTMLKTKRIETLTIEKRISDN